MHNYFIVSLLLIQFLYSCERSNETPQQNTTVQNIITSDSSDVSGRLYVEVRNATNTASVSGATVHLYLNYDDMMRNIWLYRLNSSANGVVDFGYVLQGNYYITGSGVVSRTLRADTTVVQIIPRRTVRRFLYLR